MGRQISTNSDVDSMAYSSNASEGSYGVFMTAFDRCPPTFSDDVLDRDIFPTPSADRVGGCGGNQSKPPASSTTSSNSSDKKKNKKWEGEGEKELNELEELSQEWTMFSDPSFGNRNQSNVVSKSMGAWQREEGDGCDRLVPSDGNTAMDTAVNSTVSKNDDLNAWGLASTIDAAAETKNMANNRESPITSTKKDADNQDAFGTNFFQSGFNDGQDVFFQQSDWTTPNKSTADNNNAASNNDANTTVNDPWGQMKDEDTGSVVFTSMSLPDPITPTTEPTFTHPLKRQQQQPPGKSADEVVVSFDDYDREVMQSPSNSSFSSRFNGDRNNMSSEKSNRPPVISSSKGHRRMNSDSSKSHRRINSNGSSSKGHRRMNSNGSQGSRRKGSKSGGASVGSNSTAVDQILEHYRQKRLAKQNNGKSSATSSTVSSTNHRSVPSIDSLSSVPSSDLAATAAPAASALSIIRGQKSSPLNDSVMSASSLNPVTQSSKPSPLNRSINGVVDWPDDDDYREHGGVVSSLPAITNQKRSPKSEVVTNAPSPALRQTAVSKSSKTTSAGQSNNNGVVDWPDDDGVVHHRAAAPPTALIQSLNKTTNVQDLSERFLMANVVATIGPRGSAPDMESMSLSGRSHNRGPRLRNGQTSDAQSVGSRTSRHSFRTNGSNRSSAKGGSSISLESKSVANDLFRLEAQLAAVARQQELRNASPPKESVFVDDKALNKDNSSSDVSENNGCIGAEPAPRQNPIIVVAPPGRLGILLLNNKVGGVSSTPTHVSAVRSESVLAGKVQVGDLLMKIDGEDVSKCNSKQIMAIMAAKKEFERTLEFRCLQSNYGAQEWI